MTRQIAFEPLPASVLFAFGLVVFSDLFHSVVLKQKSKVVIDWSNSEYLATQTEIDVELRR